MARKNSKAKSRRTRRSRGFNVVNAAELYLTTNVLTQNFMGTNPLEFFTGQTMGTVGTSTQLGKPTAVQGYGYFPSDPFTVTLPELLGIGSPTALSSNNIAVIKGKFKDNAIPAMVQYAGVKIGFKVGKKLLSKQRSFINNQILKPLGMKSTVVV